MFMFGLAVLSLFQFTFSLLGHVIVAFDGSLDVEVDVPLLHKLLGAAEVVGVNSYLVILVWFPLQILFHGEEGWRQCHYSG